MDVRISVDDPARAPAPPEGGLATRRLVLRPVRPTDLDFLYVIAADPAVSHRWRYRGATPAPETFARDLWTSVLVQYTVTRRTGEPVGLVTAYAADLANGHGHLGVCGSPRHLRSGLMVEAASVFLSYLFHTWPLRRVYADVPAFSLREFASGAGRWFVEEGRLRDAMFHGGRWWDRHLLTLTREAWEPHDARIRSLLRDGSLPS